MDHLDLAVAKESKRTESVLSAISGKMFENETVLTTLMPNKSVALSAASINLDQKALKGILVRYIKDSPRTEFMIALMIR